MKSFEVKAMGLEELSLNEASLVEGGIPWVQLVKTVGKFVISTAAAWGLEKCLEEVATSNGGGGGDWVYWSYGGELDAAVCVG